MARSLDSSTDTPRPEWRAACTACGWSTTAPTYAAAGDAARAHGGTCEDASTVVEVDEGPELVCDTCAPAMGDAFAAGVRAGRRLERGTR